MLFKPDPTWAAFRRTPEARAASEAAIQFAYDLGEQFKRSDREPTVETYKLALRSFAALKKPGDLS